MPRPDATRLCAAVTAAALAVLAGCAPFPEAGAPAVALSRPATAPEPRLVPVEGLAAQAAEGRIDADAEAGLAARADALRRRGDALRQASGGN